MEAGELKPGMAIKLNGELYSVVSQEHVKPGKGPAYAQMKLKNLTSGSKIEKRFRSSENVEKAFLETREMEFLYADASEAVMMDTETFEQTGVPLDVLGDRQKFLKPNMTLKIVFHESQIVDIELPPSVDLEVVDTAPQPKGSTVTNQLKPATLEGGVETRVPPFIENGEIVRIATDSGEYVGRGEKG